MPEKDIMQPRNSGPTGKTHGGDRSLQLGISLVWITQPALLALREPGDQSVVRHG